jgi:hypothetical protein
MLHMSMVRLQSHSPSSMQEPVSHAVCGGWLHISILVRWLALKLSCLAKDGGRTDLLQVPILLRHDLSRPAQPQHGAYLSAASVPCYRYSYNLGPAHVIHLSNYSPSCNSKSKTSLSCLLPIDRCAQHGFVAPSGHSGQAVPIPWFPHSLSLHLRKQAGQQAALWCNCTTSRYSCSFTACAAALPTEVSCLCHRSAQYKWLKADLAKVNRGTTPWLFVSFHEVQPPAASMSCRLQAAAASLSACAYLVAPERPHAAYQAAALRISGPDQRCLEAMHQ